MSHERERLDALVRENLDWLRGWLGARLRGHRRQDVDDLCQDILVKALAGIDRLRDLDRFPAWLYRIASNQLKDYLRRQKRRQKVLQDVEVDVAQTRTAADEVDEEEQVEKLLGAVLELPETYREPILLRHVEDMAYEDIASVLGITKNNVQVRIFRGRQMLRERLESSPQPDLSARESSPRGAADEPLPGSQAL